MIKQQLNHQGPPDGDNNSSDDEEGYQGPRDPHRHDRLDIIAAQDRKDLKLIRSPPFVYTGDRTAVDEWLEKLNNYFQMNYQAPEFKSGIVRCSYAISLMQGE